MKAVGVDVNAIGNHPEAAGQDRAGRQSVVMAPQRGLQGSANVEAPSGKGRNSGPTTPAASGSKSTPGRVALGLAREPKAYNSTGVTTVGGWRDNP